MRWITGVWCVLGCVWATEAAAQEAGGVPAPMAVRVMTFNVEDVRTEDLVRTDHPRVRAVAEVIQTLRPNIVLLNEIAYDQPGGPGVAADAVPGQNGRRFVENYLSVSQAPGLEPIRYRVFMDRVNTGQPSGFDLDRSGAVVTAVPEQPVPAADGSVAEQTPEGRAYGGDAWGFGTFPGQYGMALLVDERLEIVTEGVRTFRLFPWMAMPGALVPTVAGAAGAGEAAAWYAGEAGELFRLSSKSHWDVPVRLPNGAVVHVLASHPTPPAFDGDEQRNRKRNHDEIRFWLDYVEGAAYIADDAGKAGGLEPGAHFVIVGDLNADPDEGSSLRNPMGQLLASARVQDPRPVSELRVDHRGRALDEDDTALFGLRVDYVLPSAGLSALGGGVWRETPRNWGGQRPSDHFPVWADVSVPGVVGTGAGGGGRE
jgi:endonuclease/exonuclease/phosphatase family metal-dependent hydrolase